ncbi:hypothetical protein JCM10908_002768 [Rhodotorula pacifica]|uniref:uncharacterized protein n=1 Tax=Rhodotorula pacifica TaxID=1495444 RepID=UPI00317BAF64
MSTTQFGGPGSAFAFAAPTRPSRRTNSSSSFKDAGSTVTASAPATATTNGPAPVQPPAAPSLGSFAPLSDRDSSTLSNGNHAASDGGSPGATGTAPGRSFSSILSPSLGATANGGQLGDGATANGRGKPFVYTREFLLSLYDEDKARKRPIELAMHDTATRDLTGAAEDSHKPWLLKEYREGEKELFANSIHPSNTRPSRLNRNDSPLTANGGAGATLDLSTLGTLPRDRDRALGSPSLRSPSIDKEALGGILGGAGRDRRTRERSLGTTMGIVGGVLGGIANGTPTSRKRDESVGSTASKEGVWQGGRWRRSAQEAEEAEARSPSVTSRRLPAGDLSRQSSISDAPGKTTANGWGQDDRRDTSAETDAPAAESSAADAIPSEPEIAASLLGSLALDSEPVDDPLLSRAVDSSTTPSGTATPATAGPPPGLAPVVPPAEVMWQYRDPQGQVQGPFSATMMHDWYRQQFFAPDLRVKRTGDADFESLEILIRRTGDSDQPFLAPKPAAPVSAFSSAPGTPQPSSAWGSGASTARAQTPLEQLTAAVAQGRFGGAASGATASSPFYEPFGSNSGSPAVQGQSLPQAFGRSPLVQGAVDPWGAPLANTAGSPWNGLGQQQQQQQQQQAMQQPIFAQQQAPQQSVGGLHSPMDLLRQLAAQQHGMASPQQAFGQQPQQQQQQQQQQGGFDAFGRPSPVSSSPFFDPNQLAPGAQQTASPTAWLGQQIPQSQAQLQQPHAQPWASLHQNVASPSGAVSSPLAQFAQQPQAVAQPAAASPVGQPAPAPESAQNTSAIQSPWEEIKVEAVSPAQAPTSTAAEQRQQAPSVKSPEVQAAATPATSNTQEPEPQPQVQSPAPKATSPAPAPWAKEEKKTVKPTAAAPSPSLREIQEAEEREAEKRKEIARAQAAQAAAEAAQRQAVLDAQEAAESLPSSASWAAGPAQVPAAKSGAGAPWTKPAAAPAPVAAKGQKTLKEIQEEEERQKKAAQAAREQQQAAVGLAAGRGYAGATSAAASNASPWTTVATKPQVARTPSAAAKPVIPGLPSTAPAGPVRSVSTSSPANKPAAAATIRPAAPPVPVVRAAVPRSVNVGASSATTVYDMENPPPPSTEFLAWTKQALKGLNVPLEEFVQMLLSFPLDASADVLEIISDSVYANSSTLDGRRFANDFATRRRNDVAVRYPSIFAKGAVRTAAVKPSSMASVLATANSQPKQSEWNVKVSTKKKQKGGK